MSDTEFFYEKREEGYCFVESREIQSGDGAVQRRKKVFTAGDEVYLLLDFLEAKPNQTRVIAHGTYNDAINRMQGLLNQKNIPSELQCDLHDRLVLVHAPDCERTLNRLLNDPGFAGEWYRAINRSKTTTLH